MSIIVAWGAVLMLAVQSVDAAGRFADQLRHDFDVWKLLETDTRIRAVLLTMDLGVMLGWEPPPWS